METTPQGSFESEMVLIGLFLVLLVVLIGLFAGALRPARNDKSEAGAPDDWQPIPSTPEQRAREAYDDLSTEW